MCGPRWSVAAAQYYGSSGVSGTAKENGEESFEESRRGTFLVIHRASKMCEASAGRLEGCTPGGNQPPHWFGGEAHSWCSFLQPFGSTNIVLFLHLNTAVASQRKSTSTFLPCLVYAGLTHRSSAPFHSWRTDTNWTVAVVQLVNDPPSAAGFVYTALSPG